MRGNVRWAGQDIRTLTSSSAKILVSCTRYLGWVTGNMAGPDQVTSPNTKPLLPLHEVLVPWGIICVPYYYTLC